ncbi:L,D-transpeptidase family protein [Imhoffiella purpurea]|uniref:ErfK/YbiS/YcfS/YnhG family protein n=1 Tax=Imhoffiella purpurea TaxID=1249627 RepID=W9VFD0_9GAMM|nr:L,D-transpeptidase family protein [Imhoffiella purpurea]EXJ15711.1 ErfK/YbiS/YcfS/YnhG family protein [Imhoffiella purpurea]
MKVTPNPMQHIDSGRRPNTQRTRLSSLAARLLGTLVLVGLVGLGGCALQQEPPPQITGPVDKVVVRKSIRQLQLVSGGQVVRKYRISLGGSPVGHKYREGDQRTPVGDYTLNWRNPNSNYYKAIHISYPSDRDRMVSRQLGYSPGGMIMIHGLPNYVLSEDLRKQYAGRDWTHGCIAVQNHEIDEIWRLVPDGTPIQILP